MRKVVVTGGAGFIGSHLAEELVKQGYFVIILDDSTTGKIENVELLLKNNNVEFIQGSIVDLPLLQQLFQGVEYVFHEAAIPSVPNSINNPLASHETNMTGTLNVLIAARDNNIRKVVYASSCAVYGDTFTGRQREDLSPAPQSPYAVSKLAGEYYCRVFHKIYRLQSACLRYFNVYGPRQDPDSQYAAVIPAFIKSVIAGKPPVIFGDGYQARDFTFVEDAVQASILVAESDATGVFNIGSGTGTTINCLSKLIIRLVGSGVESVHREPRPADIRYSLADISKVKTLGYEPKYDLEQGLKKLLI